LLIAHELGKKQKEFEIPPEDGSSIQVDVEGKQRQLLVKKGLSPTTKKPALENWIQELTSKGGSPKGSQFGLELAEVSTRETSICKIKKGSYK